MEQLELFNDHFSLEEVFEAYFECRKHKRRTLNAIKFELDFEKNLIQLWRDLNDGTYKIGRSITFIVSRPVKREIFAADFRDRIVHHLIMRKLLPLFEKHFHPKSFSCRVGKGTLCGIKSAFNDIKQCSHNYTRPCYAMKLDIQAFFMSIDQRILFKKLQCFIQKYYHANDKPRVLTLVRMIVFHKPQDNCIRKSHPSEWNNLPKHKSLFCSEPFRGLPIGNLTSQIFANFYLNSLDFFIHDTDLFYARYVDDLMLVHCNSKILLLWRWKIKNFLHEQLNLLLHPKKFYLQNITKGVPFVGGYLMPYRLYLTRRFKSNFLTAMFQLKRHFCLPLHPNGWLRLLSVLCSYGGFLKHYAAYTLRHKGLQIIHSELSPFLVLSKHETMFALVHSFKRRFRAFFFAQ